MTTCNRCGGLMVPLGTAGLSAAFHALRCVNCGEVVDEVILRNRVAPPPLRRRRAPGRRG